MATDPVSAFLTGFRAVDQYETNKQRRAMMDEQMSWNRKLWGEQEKQWARDELDRYRTEKYAQFEARVQDVINSVPREEANSWFSDENMKDGEITGFSKVTNQVLKEMIAEDPEFGEHIAQAYGQDPRAGALVNNKLHPVHSVGIHPLQGVWFQVNSVNGPQPLTKFRTSQGNDPVYFGKTGLKELVKIFGPNASNSQMAITRQLHGALGIERDGSPVDTPRTQGQPSGGAGAGTNNDVIEGTAEDVTPPEETDSGFTQEETNAMGLSEAEEQAARNGLPPPLVDDLQRSEGGGAVRGRIPKPGETIEAEFVDESSEIPPENTARQAGDFTRKAIGGAGEIIRLEAGERVAAIRDFATNTFPNSPAGQFVAGLLNLGVSENQAVDGPANTPGEVPTPARRDNAPANMRTREQVDTAIANADVPSSPAAAQATADQVLRSQGKRPGFVELYNAVGLARLGVITPEQLMRYRETGQFNAAAKRNLQIVQSGNVARIFDKEAGVLSPAFRIDPTQGGGIDSEDYLKQKKSIREELEAQTAHAFVNDKNQVDKASQGQFMNWLEDIYSAYGIPDNDPRRTDNQFVNNLARGARFVQRFDEDDIQFWDNRFDFTFGDFEVYQTAANAALGGVLADNGIVAQKDAAYGLRSYLKNAPGLELTPEQTAIFAKEYEPIVQAAYREARASGKYKLPSGAVVEKGAFTSFKLEDIRDRIIEDLMEEDQKKGK